jgi:hypothetical protein
MRKRELMNGLAILMCMMFAQSRNSANAQAISAGQLASLEMKYWQMRGRLIGDESNSDKFNGFVSLGNQKGQSLVFHTRHPFESPWHFDYSKDPTMPGDCRFQLMANVVATPSMYKDPRDNKDARGRMKASENPLINHGWYMAVLPTEFALLQREGQDVSAVAEETDINKKTSYL